MRTVELIERKRDGGEHAPGEIAWLLQGYVAGRVAPEQMSAWAMAVVFRGLSDAETHELTQTMVDSGARIDLSSLGRTVVDKHSTGGVGDKTTIALAPLAAAMGMPVAKLSGRGLAHTGGTLDKLEAIPGLRVGLTVAELVAQVQRIGCALAAQTSNLVPADRLLYALRDVTGTVPAPGLIAASVMSKKLAAGADAILLDVKVGEGAFMPDLASARELAVCMRDIGERAGRPTVCELTAMDAPLGGAVGNALEVAEACEMLAGRGPLDFRELVLGSAARMAVLSDLGSRPLRGAPAGRGGGRLGQRTACARAAGRGAGRRPARCRASLGGARGGARRRRGGGSARGLRRTLRRARDRPGGDATGRRP